MLIFRQPNILLKKDNYKMHKLITTILVCYTFQVHSQIIIPLYEGKIPGAKIIANGEGQKYIPSVDTVLFKVSQPVLTFFPADPAKNNGTTVLILPGGGYHALLINREGNRVARAFSKLGVNAFVLKYRLPSPEAMQQPFMAPIQDAQQAIKRIRESAVKLKLNPNKVGVMGFSAGGHLAASVGMHYRDAYVDNPTKINLRPDFMLLVNPVISFTDSIGHKGSRDNLLGSDTTIENIRYFSNELHIDSLTPPSFLVHAGDDTVVPVENSLFFYTGLRKYKIPAALHIYSKGEHGFLQVPEFEEWFGRCVYWMKQEGFIR